MSRWPALCQLLPSPASLPDTVSPEVCTVTFVSVPATAVTVMRSDGLASWLPSTGGIVRSLARAAACAWADAEAWALLWAGETVEWLPLLHAVASRPMAAAAAMPAYRRPRRPGLRSVPRTVTLPFAPPCNVTQFTCAVQTEDPDPSLA